MDLETFRLKIQELTEYDLPDIHRKNSITAVAEFNTIGIPIDIKDTERILVPILEDKANKERTKYGWAIRIKESNDFIGEIGINLAASRFKKGEIYYSFLPKFWGKGYGIEAVKAIIKHGFNQLKLHRIEAGVATENIKSINLLEKAGMTREGLGRKILPIRGEWKDNYQYAILESEQLVY